MWEKLEESAVLCGKSVKLRSNELKLQTLIQTPDSGPKLWPRLQTLTPNSNLDCRLWPQTLTQTDSRLWPKLCPDSDSGPKPTQTPVQCKVSRQLSRGCHVLCGLAMLIIQPLTSSAP